LNTAFAALIIIEDTQGIVDRQYFFLNLITLVHTCTDFHADNVIEKHVRFQKNLSNKKPTENWE
jgi:hypothetical protein